MVLIIIHISVNLKPHKMFCVPVQMSSCSKNYNSLSSFMKYILFILTVYDLYQELSKMMLPLFWKTNQRMCQKGTYYVLQMLWKTTLTLESNFKILCPINSQVHSIYLNICLLCFLFLFLTWVLVLSLSYWLEPWGL